jgi:hypothetical protein
MTAAPEAGQGQIVTIENFSPHGSLTSGTPSGVPIYAYSGWFDGAMVNGQIKAYHALAAPGTRLRLGPWFHGGEFNASPFAKRGRPVFDHAAEIIRFFDRHLRGGVTPEGELPVEYYTMGAEEWRGATTWPPPGAQWVQWHLGAGRRLTPAMPAEAESRDTYTINATLTSGGGSRWGMVVGTGAVRGYPDRRRNATRMLTYTTPPLTQAVEVTGHPRLSVFLSANAPDGALFAYLEDVAPGGRVTYVTEGQLRLIHRRQPRSFRKADAEPLVPSQVTPVAFDLLPTSYVFPAGHAIRVSFAGVDAATFSNVLPVTPLVYDLHRDAAHPSRIELPTYPRR